MIEHQIKLNLKTPEPILLHMKQYDAGSHVIKAELYDGDTAYTIPEDAAVMLRFRKPDGTGGLYDTADIGGAITYSGSTVTIPVATQVLTTAGKVEAEIDIYSDETLLSSFIFHICVHISAFSDRNIEPDDYYCVLTQQIAEILDAAADAAAVASMQSAVAAKADPPCCITITITKSWQGNGPFTQVVSIPGGTANSKVDLQPEAAVLSQLLADGVTALYIGNENGEFTAYAIGAAPTVALTLQATITEVTV